VVLIEHHDPGWAPDGHRFAHRVGRTGARAIRCAASSALRIGDRPGSRGRVGAHPARRVLDDV